VKHQVCLTLDTDPDGLSGKETNRRAMEWTGLEQVQRLPEELDRLTDKLGWVPITWFVRADGQLESILGTSAYLLETYNLFWTQIRAAGHELAWHPHLYRQANLHEEPALITDDSEVQEELSRLWGELKSVLPATAFRNGEGWHTSASFAAVERLGFHCDSTAIPGRRGAAGHPMNWSTAPNQPYFPAADELGANGTERAMIELPMNTWRVQAPYDDAPRVRYMNPAIHPELFAKALAGWEVPASSVAELHVWVLVFHPDEVLSSRGPDGLYARSRSALATNLMALTERLHKFGYDFEWATVSDAATRWRKHRRRLVA
jgi:hypothetical protein